MRRRARASALLASCVLILIGCAQPELPRDAFHRLAVADPQSRPGPPLLPGTLEIQRLSADGLTGERPLLYAFRDEPQVLRQYSYNFWNDVPPAIVQEQLVRYLRAARAADTVVTPGLRQRADYELVGTIKRFEQVIGPPHGVTVEAELGMVRVKDDKLLLLKTYRAERPSAEDTPAAAATAINEAIDHIFAHFVEDLAAPGVR